MGQRLEKGTHSACVHRASHCCACTSTAVSCRYHAFGIPFEARKGLPGSLIPPNLQDFLKTQPQWQPPGHNVTPRTSPRASCPALVTAQVKYSIHSRSLRTPFTKGYPQEGLTIMSCPPLVLHNPWIYNLDLCYSQLGTR